MKGKSGYEGDDIGVSEVISEAILLNKAL